jgi:hypothetical protein
MSRQGIEFTDDSILGAAHMGQVTQGLGTAPTTMARIRGQASSRRLNTARTGGFGHR